MERQVTKIEGVLARAGVGGFLGNLDVMYDEADESAAQAEAFVLALREKFGDQDWAARELADAIRTDEELKSLTPDEIGVDQPGSLTRRVAAWLRKHQGTRYGPEGRHVLKVREVKKTARWVLRRH
jgi:hypothetical protein